MTSLPGDQSTKAKKSYRLVKLTKTDEFSSVFDFRRRISTEHLVLHFRPNQLGYARLGLVAAKKVAKQAVARNYMRRVMRTFFQMHQPSLRACDLVVQVRKKFGHAEFSSVQQQFNHLSQRLALQYDRDVSISSASIESRRS